MSLASQVASLATRIGTEFKTIRSSIGSLPNLATAAKGDLVSAVNEVRASVPGPGVQINDTIPSTTTVYSASKTDAQITAATTALVNGAPATFDTFKEIADYIAADQSGAAGVTSSLAQRLRLDAAGGYSTTQVQQGQDNLQVYSRTQIGNPDTDLVAVFNSALA